MATFYPRDALCMSAVFAAIAMKCLSVRPSRYCVKSRIGLTSVSEKHDRTDGTAENRSTRWHKSLWRHRLTGQRGRGLLATTWLLFCLQYATDASGFRACLSSIAIR